MKNPASEKTNEIMFHINISSDFHMNDPETTKLYIRYTFLENDKYLDLDLLFVEIHCT